jgi:hypothetical protein
MRDETALRIPAANKKRTREYHNVVSIYLCYSRKQCQKLIQGDACGPWRTSPGHNGEPDALVHWLL